MNWRVIGASVVGSSHREVGLDCDDYHSYRQADDLLLLAVADGAGSAELGGLGAQLAVEAVLDALSDSLSEPVEDLAEVLLQAFRIARHVLKAESVMQKKPLRAFATTLLVAILTPDYLAAAQLGDGAIVAKCGGEWQMLTVQHKGEHANETVFLTTRDPQRFVSITVEPVDNLEALMLLTDGLENIALNLRENKAHPPFFNALYRFAKREESVEELEQQLRQELASSAIEARTDDDKTLLIAVRDKDDLPESQSR